VSRFQFVADHCATYPVKRLCMLVEVERSSYYAWAKAAPAREARVAADAALADRIRKVHSDDNTCGAPRVTAELNDGVPADQRVNHKRVARVMRDIVGYRRRRKVRTTIPEPADQKVPDLLNRDFTAPAPNLRYVGDITYLPLADGNNLYLATVIDCYSRRLAGWSIANHMRTELVTDALKAAQATRGSLAGAVFHSDHGSVYTSKDYARLCTELAVTQSMGAVGTGADNSLAESFNATLKREVLQDQNSWRRDHLPPPDLRLAGPLQHPPQALLVPLPVPEHLRDQPHRYPPDSRVIHHRVQEPGVRPDHPHALRRQEIVQGHHTVEEREAIPRLRTGRRQQRRLLQLRQSDLLRCP
jgi:transposase InsO family protein